jgi:DNA-binding CsgD family transcriptional regulator
MRIKDLSPREEEILGLCIQGLTNDGIAAKLGLSIGTVNTYWVRIRLKVGGNARTDTVARIIKERAEKALRSANVERADMAATLLRKEQDLLDLRAALALLNLAMVQIKSTVWATDVNLKIQIIANGEYPSTNFGVVWEVGKTIQEIFKTTDPASPALAAHFKALASEEMALQLTGEFDSLSLHVLPLRDETDETKVIGCITILNRIGGPNQAPHPSPESGATKDSKG